MVRAASPLWAKTDREMSHDSRKMSILRAYVMVASAMPYWLLKSDPETYSWDDLVRDKETDWTGVRNFQARNNLRAMKVGDKAFVYHSQDDKEIVGIADIIETAKPDPTAEEGDWSSVRIKARAVCGRPLGLEEIRNTPGLNTMVLVTNSRLSVQPVTEAQWNAILKYTKTMLS